MNWFLAKVSVFEKAECVALALKALDQAYEFAKEKDGQSFNLNLQLQKAHLLIKLQSLGEAQKLLQQVKEASYAFEDDETLTIS